MYVFSKFIKKLIKNQKFFDMVLNLLFYLLLAFNKNVGKTIKNTPNVINLKIIYIIYIYYIYYLFTSLNSRI